MLLVASAVSHHSLGEAAHLLDCCCSQRILRSRHDIQFYILGKTSRLPFLTTARPVTRRGFIANELRPHDSLGDMTPAEYMENYTGNTTFQLST